MELVSAPLRMSSLIPSLTFWIARVRATAFAILISSLPQSTSILGLWTVMSHLTKMNVVAEDLASLPLYDSLWKLKARDQLFQSDWLSHRIRVAFVE